jgi:Flp pilus assembly protein TadB
MSPHHWNGDADDGSVGRNGPVMIALVAVALAVTIAAVPLRPRRRRAGPVAAPAPSPLAVLASRWTQRRDRHRQSSARHVAAWCDEIARRVRSGSSLRDSVVVVPPDATTERSTSAFRLTIDRGLSISEAVARVDDPGPHLRLALEVLATTSRIGGPAAASIDRTAVLLRQRAADLDERASQAAQARLSTHVLTVVPLLMLAVLVTTDDDVRDAVTSPVGATCVTVGLALNIIGWWWMRQIVGTSS